MQIKDNTGKIVGSSFLPSGSLTTEQGAELNVIVKASAGAQYQVYLIGGSPNNSTGYRINVDATSFFNGRFVY